MNEQKEMLLGLRGKVDYFDALGRVMLAMDADPAREFDTSMFFYFNQSGDLSRIDIQHDGYVTASLEVTQITNEVLMSLIQNTLQIQG